jgi:hypothetical protein
MSSDRSALLKDVAASAAGSAASVYTGQPFDTIKVRMQIGQTAFRGPIDCLMQTIRAEGATKLWRGSLPALVGALSENSVAFGVNGLLTRFMKKDDHRKKALWEPFLNGGITGCFSAVVLCPCDVVKCRTQIIKVTDTTSGSGEVMGVIRDLLRTRGFKGFFAGFSAQVRVNVCVPVI